MIPPVQMIDPVLMIDKEEAVSNGAQAINPDVDDHGVDDHGVDDHGSTSAPILRAAADLGVPAAAAAMVDRMGIRMIAERVAAVARLSGQARVLITGCRDGDGASTVAGALALDLSLRLSLETLLVDADSAGSAEAAGGNGGRPMRANPTPVARLWTLRCPRMSDQAHTAAVPMSTRPDPQADAVEDLRQTMACYRAVVVDVGVVRLDARMVAVAGPDDPVLVVVRYGCTRREELAATLAILHLAKCKIGGVILNGYESPATDWLQRIVGFGKERRCEK
jgi:Mrp family chromosome partitioning ATPase